MGDSGLTATLERRAATDRRIYSYDKHYPERRKGGDRRGDEEPGAEIGLRAEGDGPKRT
ncbi:hypothetical protein [Desulfoluna spongiiphila]|uniref:hypothetical protein n=1 Tax=Desulfoluna spongiiphila TaxID=419481 RepID=UPI00186A36A9|nr:hypothetical protein [Desulfoluna spongiiphila]